MTFKICGLTRAEDARAAAEAGATYGGVILAPGRPRSVEPGAVAAIFAGSALSRCGVFVDEPRDRLIDLVGELRLEIVQLHGAETPEQVDEVRALSDASVWKAIRPRTGDEFSAAVERYAGVADGLLIDGWSAVAPGGTGARFPWAEVARLRHRVDPSVRVIVAGGLTPENVAGVIEMLAPDVVDVSSGVEQSPGIKDREAVHRFGDAVRSAMAREGVS